MHIIDIGVDVFSLYHRYAVVNDLEPEVVKALSRKYRRPLRRYHRRWVRSHDILLVDDSRTLAPWERFGAAETATMAIVGAAAITLALLVSIWLIGLVLVGVGAAYGVYRACLPARNRKDQAVIDGYLSQPGTVDILCPNGLALWALRTHAGWQSVKCGSRLSPYGMVAEKHLAKHTEAELAFNLEKWVRTYGKRARHMMDLIVDDAEIGKAYRLEVMIMANSQLPGYQQKDADAAILHKCKQDVGLRVHTYIVEPEDEINAREAASAHEAVVALSATLWQ